MQIDEVKAIHDKAVAVAAYARQAKDNELVDWAVGSRIVENSLISSRYASCSNPPIPSLPPPNLSQLLATIRQLTQWYQAGQDPDSFVAFRDRVSLLLSVTILDTSGGVRLTKGPRSDVRILSGWKGPDDPVPLTDGKCLRLTLVLYREPTSNGPRVKVKESSFQYHADRLGDHWIFRYDYLRDAPDQHPHSHLHIRGTLTEPCLPPGTPLDRIHFPTDRIALESIIRLLIEQFGVPATESPDVWRPLLAESERAFQDIKHRSISGPAQE